MSLREPSPDPFNPSYYGAGSAIECIDAIIGMGAGKDYCRGNVVKYLWRLGRKGDELEDLGKAKWYIECLIRIVKEEEGR